MALPLVAAWALPSAMEDRCQESDACHDSVCCCNEFIVVTVFQVVASAGTAAVLWDGCCSAGPEREEVFLVADSIVFLVSRD